MSELSVTGGRDVHTVHFPLATPPDKADVLIVGGGPVRLVGGHRTDDFNINIDVQTEGLEQFINGVVAQLQRRGRFRQDYEYGTFRENLGVA